MFPKNSEKLSTDHIEINKNRVTRHTDDSAALVAAAGTTLSRTRQGKDIPFF